MRQARAAWTEAKEESEASGILSEMASPGRGEPAPTKFREKQETERKANRLKGRDAKPGG